jgi:hypothetical protein
MKLKIKILVEKFQRWVADFLSDYTRDWSTRKKKIYLILFGLVSGGMSILIVAETLLVKPKETWVFIQRLHIPASIGKPGIQWKNSHDAFTKETWEKMEVFSLYMDSISRLPNGRQQVDSLLKKFPGIMDSIRSYEKLYPSQKIKD